MLKHLDLKHVYDSADCDLVKDLIIPLLGGSIEYWRGVGFFTSGWLQTACKGIVNFVENGGFARIVTSPILQVVDWEAIKFGDEAKRDKTLRDLLRSQVFDLANALSKDTLNALAWMIADEALEFRFAIPRDFNSGGDYHDKVGVFIDNNKDFVAIHGSFNDSKKGSLNGEAFSVFKSWVEGQQPFAERHRFRLLQLWKKGNAQFDVLQLPEAVKKDIVNLRSGKRPYSKDGTKESVSFSINDLMDQKIKLRAYQRDAIDCWEKALCCGVFEMATGTGKTYTALASAFKKRQELGPLALVIIVPYIHLLDQWRQNCEKFDFFPILCSGNHNQWPREVRSKIQDFRLGILPSICIIAVHQTAASDKFTKTVEGLLPERTMLIADEVHSLGATHLRKGLLPNAALRLGLSATPRRWYDQEGTQTLFNYFSGICFDFPLERAIGEFLTPYRYFPITVYLTDEEMEDYDELSRKIASIAPMSHKGDHDAKDRLKKLLLKRSHIISSAQNKLPLLLSSLQSQISEYEKQGKELRDVLIYCAPGTHRNILFEVSKLGLRCHEFVHTVSIEKRQTLLGQFSNGDIQVLIAIHCLDEGIDIPSTKTAYFLSSTTNPREFVQRRGRVLRKFKGKTCADVYDFIVVPDINFANLRREVDLSILRREMPRFAEFSSSASNEFEARSVIREIVNKYHMLHLLDIKPWEIYHEVMETVEITDRS